MSDGKGVVMVPGTSVVYSDAVVRGTVQRVKDMLECGWTVLGKNTEEFETRWANVIGRTYAVSTSNDTAALEIAFRLANVKDRYVVIPTSGFYSIVTAIDRAGGKPLFVDISIGEYANYDPVLLAQTLETYSGQIAAVVTMPNGGYPITPAILDVLMYAKKIDPQMMIIGDNAQGHGSSVNGVMTGGFEDIACFSFYATKTINCGEGGMILTDDKWVADEARMYRNYGRAGEFGSSTIVRNGNNWRMTEMQAALGAEQVGDYENILARRRAVAYRYLDAAHDGKIGEIALFVPKDGTTCGWYKIIALLPDGVDKAKFKEYMRLLYGVVMGADNYDLPITQQPIFIGRYGGIRAPAAEEFSRRHVCLPMGEDFTVAQTDIVIEGLKTFRKGA